MRWMKQDAKEAKDDKINSSKVECEARFKKQGYKLSR